MSLSKVNIRCRAYFHSCLVPRVALWLGPSTRAVVGLCTQAGFTGRNLTIGQRNALLVSRSRQLIRLETETCTVLNQPLLS